MITKGLRRQDHLSPGGHVTLYKDEDFFLHTGEARELRRTQYNFQDGDFVVRLGKFSQDWIWHPSPRIEAFLCDLRQVRPWWLVARYYPSVVTDKPLMLSSVISTSKQLWKKDTYDGEPTKKMHYLVG